MNLLFFGVACTESVLNESNIKFYGSKVQVRPQQYFDLSLIKGLSNICYVEAVSLPPVSAYPNSNCIFYKGIKEQISKKLFIRYITLPNITGVKSLFIMFHSLLKTFSFSIKNRKKDAAILCGYISFETAFPAMIIAKIFDHKVFAMVPDSPRFVSTYSEIRNPIKKVVNKLFVKINVWLESKFDGYIFLTEEMDNLINRNRKPYIVVEGMINENEIKVVDEIKKYSSRVIMYAGTLHEKFGIKKLVESFIAANLSDCELWIFGEGDYSEDLKIVSKDYKNINYKGSVSKKEILEFEKRVTLLINPRPSNEDYTRYSFPSKTLEYMASGTPLLTTKLPGIPKEYDDYLYYFHEEDINSMAKRLKEIISQPSEKLKEFGLNSRDFVINNKTNKIQTEKIFQFINSSKNI